MPDARKVDLTPMFDGVTGQSGVLPSMVTLLDALREQINGLASGGGDTVAKADVQALADALDDRGVDLARAVARNTQPGEVVLPIDPRMMDQAREARQARRPAPPAPSAAPRPAPQSTPQQAQPTTTPAPTPPRRP